MRRQFDYRARPAGLDGRALAPSRSPRTKVFISYSHADKEWLERLKRHLKPLVREGHLDCWDDTHIRPGDDWQQEIRTALDKAQVAVLLISVDFFASDFIDENELLLLLTAAQTKGVRILPLIISASRFARDQGLARFQAVNSPDRPLNKMPAAEQEEILDRLAQTIESAPANAAVPLESPALPVAPPTIPLDFSGTAYEPSFDKLLLHTSPNLFRTLCALREVIIPVLRRIPNSLYSLDAEGHARQCLRLMSTLYYPVFESCFSPDELFTVGFLCLVHDVGMMPRENMTDIVIYQNHCQYSYDYVMSLVNINIVDRHTIEKVAHLCLDHNKPIGRAKSALSYAETPHMRLYLIFLMFRIADMLEIELHPGAFLRMYPDIVTSNVGEFDINSAQQTITLKPALDSELKYFRFWANLLSDRLKESEDEFDRVGIHYRLIVNDRSAVDAVH